MFFVIGIAMEDGNGTNTVHGMWSGETEFSSWGVLPRETQITTDISGRGVEVGPIGSQAMWFDGRSTQDIGLTIAGTLMVAAGSNIFHVPAYRGYISAVLYNNGPSQWYLGSSPSLAQYSFEVSSYHATHPQLATYARVGSDSNPINVIYDLLAAKLGKLGIPLSLIDITSFQAAQYTLHTETHGYSRAIEEFSDAGERIQEIEKQIDGVVRENTTTGLIEIKLVRNDYDPATIPHITRNNCDDIVDFAMGGRSNLVNKLRLIYTDRANDYQDGSVVDQNPANAVGQDGQVVEQVINMPGVCTEALAQKLVVREMAARSRSIMRCRALVDRSFLRVNVGDAVKLTWTNPDIAGIVFRVANVDRGTLEDGKIALDLIQDYFYVYRGQAPRAPDFRVDGGGLVSG
jgi:hypothetical protein